MNIPFVDLHAQYLSIKEDIDKAIQDVITQTAFIKGSFVSKFETDYAALYNVKHCIGVANGTDALYITLKMLGIGHGDEVITAANSWISSSETISQTGAKPIFIDHDDYFTIDVSKIEEKITSRTKAIVPVHLYGQMADVHKIERLCKKHNLYLIEDCAQAHFASLEEKKAGLTGIASTFSFFPAKNLGAYGDAGAIITNDDDLALAIRKFANHGMLKRHHHEFEGINSRLDGLQAAILSAKLPHILNWTDQRIKNANHYFDALKDISEIELPKVRNGAKHVFHLFVIKTEHRDKLADYLESKGIGTSVHYPTPLPLLPAYSNLGYVAADIPRASENQKRILSIPMFPELKCEEIDYIAECIRNFF
jgi:dTDP-4-amino-4,6-dideoxygalactose transaminase